MIILRGRLLFAIDSSKIWGRKRERLKFAGEERETRKERKRKRENYMGKDLKVFKGKLS